jgi:transposase
MPILPPAPTADTPRCFASPPWHDQHPERLALERDLPADHLARRIDDAVARLDLRDLGDAYAGSGSAAYPPDVLLRAVLFETQRGHHSPATWFRDASESGPLRWLLRGCRPARSCWYAFRDRIAPLLRRLNTQPLIQAVAQGLTPATRGADDGTFVAANASRHRLLNEATLNKRLGELEAALAADQQGQPPPAVPGWMARQPATRQKQRDRYTQARQHLAQRQAHNRRKAPSKRTPESKVVVSASDPQAALGLDKEDVYRPLYNVQVVDDLDSPFVLGYEVFAQASDAGLLGTMLSRVQEMVGHCLKELLADTAYAGGADLKAAAKAGVTVYAPLPKESPDKAKQFPKSAFTWLEQEQTYTCPQGQRLELESTGKRKRCSSEDVVVRRYRCPPVHCLNCPLQQACAQKPASGRTVSRSEHEEEIEALRARMAETSAKELYKLRRQTVELVNADWKAHRQLRRLSGRGLERARCQVGLLVLAHNLLTLLSEEKKAHAAAVAAASP